jgi:predicted Rossmann-fold nucleotide-binding protein
MLFAADVRERKALLLQHSDVITALPGGLGTLDEAAEILALRRHNAHQRPVIILNIGGLYDGLKKLFVMMEVERFLANLDGDVVPGLDGAAHFADTPQHAMDYIEIFGEASGECGIVPSDLRRSHRSPVSTPILCHSNRL